MIESLNISSMSSYFFPNIGEGFFFPSSVSVILNNQTFTYEMLCFPLDVDSSESNSVHTLCESDNDLSDISLFESSDEEITDQDDDQEKCKSVGPVVTGSEIGTHTSSLEPVVQVKNGGDQDTAVSILPIITNSFSERQPIEDACPNSLEAVSDSVPDCDVELNAAEISKTAYSSNGQLKNNGTSNDSSIKSPPTENYECNLPKLKEINVSTYKSGASSWIPLHSIASSGGEVTLLTRKKINSPTTAPSNEISLLAKKLTAPSVAQGSDVTLSTKNKVLPLTITPGTEVTLISKNQVVDEKSLNEMHKESTKPKLLPLSQQLEKLIPGTGTKKPSGQLISKADSILNQISDCKKPLTIFGATTVTPIIVPNKSSDSSLKPSTPDNRDCVIKPVISSVHSRNGIRNVPTQATPVSLVRNVFRSPSRKYNQHSLREIPSYPNKSANSVNGNIIPLLPKSSGLNAAPVVITPVSNFLQKKKCQLGTGYYLEVVPANVGSQFPKELSVNSTTNVSNPTSSAHSISDKVTPVLITSQVSFCSNNNNSLSNTRPTTEEAPYCVSDGYKDSNVLTSSLLQNENSSDSTSFPTLSSQSRDPEESDGLTNSIEESEETCQESKELSCESDDAPSDDWFKIVAFKSITEDEFWCKDNSAQDCAT